MKAKHKSKLRLKTEQISFKVYKEDSLKAASDLKYSDEVKQKIQDAKTEGDIIRALIKGRQTY